jgi:hypothetical protein
MFGSDVIDVAIGIVFVYLLVSFVCSAAVELVEVVLKNRPKKLMQGIAELLQSDDWVKKIYNDPQVSALFKGTFAPSTTRNLPSYIPSRNFALAVLNQLEDPSQLNTSVEKLALTSDETTALDALRAKSPLDEVDKAKLKVLEAKEHIYQALKSALLTTEGDINKVIKNIEDWYNSSMDRVSGWFKRRTHMILLCFGAVAAVVYNIDSMFIVTRLANDKTVRQAVVASAGATISDAQKQASKPAATDTTNKAALDRLTQAIDTMQTETKGLIGWGEHPVFDSDLIRPALRDHGVGWLLTAIAVSFGAPFWFDVLNKFMVVRSTVKPKEKSEPEGSKDAKESKEAH